MAIDLDVAAAGFVDEWCGGAPAATATLVALLKQAKADGTDEARAQLHAAPAPVAAATVAVKRAAKKVAKIVHKSGRPRTRRR